MAKNNSRAGGDQEKCEVNTTPLIDQMLVLPVDNTFVYIEPIYIQASEARMPQLKKVATIGPAYAQIC